MTEFSKGIQEALDTKVYENERMLGQRFGVCRQQVIRWMEDRSLPLPGVQEIVLRIIKKGR